jgi:hypothetical protein
MLQRGGPGLSRSLRRPGPFFSGPDNDRVDSLVVRASAPTKATAASVPEFDNAYEAPHALSGLDGRCPDSGLFSSQKKRSVLRKI